MPSLGYVGPLQNPTVPRRVDHLVASVKKGVIPNIGPTIMTILYPHYVDYDTVTPDFSERVQNYGPFLDPYYSTAPSIWGIQKGTIILTTTRFVGRKCFALLCRGLFAGADGRTSGFASEKGGSLGFGVWGWLSWESTANQSLNSLNGAI